MKSLRFDHHVISLRYQSGKRTLTNTKLEADIHEELIQACLVEPGTVDISPIENAASTAHSLFSVRIPAWHAPHLMVESGRVTQNVLENGTHKGSAERFYLLASCRGVLLMLVEDLSPKKPKFAWRDVSDRKREELPVVLGPSGALSLIYHLLETHSASHIEEALVSETLSVIESPVSPYPPHTSPLTICGREWDREQKLIDGGILRDCSGYDFNSGLVLHPDRWTRPFGALAPDKLGSLRVVCRGASSVPKRALFVETLTPLSSGRGITSWEGVFSIIDESNTRSIDLDPIQLKLDARQVLQTVVGARERDAHPALVSDPIAGDRYGLSPSLVTDLSTSDIFG